MYRIQKLGRKQNIDYRSLVFSEKIDTHPLTVGLLSIKGKRPGPTMLWIAVQHGMEFNGAISIQNLLRTIDPHRLRGTILAIPMANPGAFVSGTWSYPPDGHPWQIQAHWLPRETHDFPKKPANPGKSPEPARPSPNAPGPNMNRCWPGDPDGSITHQIVHAIYQEAACKADFCVDFHSHFYWNTEVAILHTDHNNVINFGRALGCRVNHRSPYNSAILTRHLCNQGVPAISVELVPTHLVNQQSVAEGERMLHNSLIHARMIPGRPRLPKVQYEFTYDDEKNLLAPAEGIVSFLHKAPDVVRKGHLLAEIFDPFSMKLAAQVKAPFDCIVSRGSYNAYVKPGFMMAKLVNLKNAFWSDE